MSAKFWQSTISAIQTRTCLDCGATPAEPYAGEHIPYCETCKKAHAKRRKRQEADK